MARIRLLQIKNFRALKALNWAPFPGLNCLVGPGDSGKSTILDAIELVLGSGRYHQFTDADFYGINIDTPIEIIATIGDLPDEMKNLEAYGDYLCGFNLENNDRVDEPAEGLELALTLKLTVGADLVLEKRLYSDRSEGGAQERWINSKHRDFVSAARLGASSNQHFAWGARSVLTKLSQQELEIGPLLNQLSREMRQSFAANQPPEVAELLGTVNGIANGLGVELGELSAQLDVKATSMASGAIALHNHDGSPLKQLGTGSTRLLLSGLHKHVSNASILLVDEAEHGLEPYRISRLLTELGAKGDENAPQVFITTHSPYVLRELQSQQLCVLRKHLPDSPAFIFGNYSHDIKRPSADSKTQATIRVCAEAFLSKTVIVCEGKTEVGLVRGLDLFLQETMGQSLTANGVYCADGGGGSNFYDRAKVFKQLGYEVCIFKDSDTEAEHVAHTAGVTALGISIFEWGDGHALESALFTHCPSNAVTPLMDIAADWKGADRISAAIEGYIGNNWNLVLVRENFVDGLRPYLAKLSQGPKKENPNKKWPSWYKDIEPSERIGREVVGPNLHAFGAEFQTVIRSLMAFGGIDLP